MKKKLLATVLVLGGILSAGYVSANTILADNNSPHETIVAKIAERFDLNKDDVEAVFQSVRDERQAEMKTQRQEKLSQAVTDKVISEDQKNAILSKMEEHENERGQKREEMQSWYQEQGIDETALREYLGFGPRGMGERNGSGPAI